MATDIEQITINFIKRNARMRGPTSSNAWNDQGEELAVDLTALSSVWNNILVPLLSTVPNGTNDLDAYENGLSGKTLYVDSDVTASDNSSYWSTGNNRPTSIKEQFDDIYTQLANSVQELQTLITASTPTAALISIRDVNNLFSSTNVEDALQEIMEAIDDEGGPLEGTPTLSQVLLTGANGDYIPVSNLATVGDDTAPGLVSTGTDTYYPAIFAKGYNQSDLNGAPWQGSTMMVTGESPNNWVSLVGNITGDNGIGIYGEAVAGIGVWGEGDGDGTSFKACGVFGRISTSATPTQGAAVVGHSGTTSAATIIALGLGAGVFGYSPSEAGVKGMSAAAAIPGVLGLGYATATNHTRAIEGKLVDTKGIAIVGLSKATQDLEAGAIVPFSGATILGVADIDSGGDIWVGTAGYATSTGNDGWGVWGEADKGVGVVGWTDGGSYSAGVVGIASNSSIDSIGVIGVRKNSNQGAAYTLGKGAGVVGYSDKNAGVLGKSISTGVPGVLGISHTGAGSRGVDGRALSNAGVGTVGIGVTLDSEITISGDIYDFGGAGVFGLANSDGDSWVGVAGWGKGSTFDNWGGWFGSEYGRGVTGWTGGGLHPAGVVGELGTATGALGAGVIGVRGGGNTNAASIMASGAGVIGYSDLTAGVLGYTATADLPGVQGGAGHTDGIGVHGYAGTLNPAVEASSWSGAGVAGSSKVAGKYGIGGEYLNTASYGEGIEGWNGANGSGVAGYCAATTGDLSVGVWGQAWSTTTSGAGVMGAKGSNNALPNITNALMGGVGVFGYSEYTAGVYGYPGATGIPGVKAQAFATGSSPGLYALKGSGTSTGAIFAGPSSGTYSSTSQMWSGTTITAIVDSDLYAHGDEWTGIVSWSPRTTGWVASIWGESNNGPAMWGKSRGGGDYANDAYGIVGELMTGLTEGAGVLGISHFSSYAPASSSAKGAGVVGCSDLTAGVLGISNASGVPGLLASGLVGDANGVVGIGHGEGVGGVFVASGISTAVSAWGHSAAVFAKASSNANVSIYALGPGGAQDIAIEGDTSTGIGVYGYSSGTGNAGYFECDGSGPSLMGDSQYGTGYGIIARADSTTPVKSAFRLHPQDTAPSSPAEGDVYANSTTHKLGFYNGTAWCNLMPYEGTGTNDDAAAGIIGEIITATAATDTVASWSTNTAKNITSIDLTAGDWDIDGVVAWGGATAGTYFVSKATTTTANVGSDPLEAGRATHPFMSLANSYFVQQIPTTRFSLAAPATVYLAAQIGFTGGTPTAGGTIRARRVR